MNDAYKVSLIKKILDSDEVETDTASYKTVVADLMMLPVSTLQSLLYFVTLGAK